MININLKPGARRQAPKGDSMAAVRARWQAIRESIKEPALVLAGVTWAVVLVALAALFLRSNARLGALEPQLQTAQDEYKRYHNFVNEKKREGLARDSILSQIGAISTIDQERYVWVHILDELAAAMPDNTWLTSVSSIAAAPRAATDSTVAPPSVLIVGLTGDLQNYTALLRHLGESHWLSNVLPVKTETVIDKDNRPITAFTLQASFARADTGQIQTVPITASTVR